MDAYLDGELDPVTSQKAEEHLRDCPKCEQAYEVETAMAHAIGQAAPYYKAPPELRERIQVSLREAEQFLATQLIASHVRSLMADHLTDVASSDQHTVKPWLDVKLDFAAPVVDLSGDGFPLIGGRLDYLDNRPVAALVYGRRKHFINLFVWPATSDEAKAPKTITREGYQLLHWADSDFNYWAVSDVNINDLQLFKQQFETRTARH